MLERRPQADNPVVYVTSAEPRMWQPSRAPRQLAVAPGWPSRSRSDSLGLALDLGADPIARRRGPRIATVITMVDDICPAQQLAGSKMLRVEYALDQGMTANPTLDLWDNH